MPRRALEITAEICAALEFSHRHGIIHRDIKPGNVMLTQTGQIKVMDFGIARALASGASTMTQTSAVIGTAQYLSPEQARGEAVDARSDVYATGCVLYELLCGQPPFVGDSPVSVAYQHVREDAEGPEPDQPRRPAARSTRSCSRRWRRTRSTGTRAPARCGPTCCGRPPAGRCTPSRSCRDDDRPTMLTVGPLRPRRPTRRCRPGSATDRRRRTSGWAIAALDRARRAGGGRAGRRPHRVAAARQGRRCPTWSARPTRTTLTALSSLSCEPTPRESAAPACGPAEQGHSRRTCHAGPEGGSRAPRSATTWCAGPDSVTIPPLIGQDTGHRARPSSSGSDWSSEFETDRQREAARTAWSSPTRRSARPVPEGVEGHAEDLEGQPQGGPGRRRQGYTEDGGEGDADRQGLAEYIDPAHRRLTRPGPGRQGHQPGSGPHDLASDPSKVKITIAVGDYTPPSPTGEPSQPGG